MDHIANAIALIFVKPVTSGLLHLYWALGNNLFFVLTGVSVGAFVILLPYTLWHNRNVSKVIHRRAQHNHLRRLHRNNRTYTRELSILAEAEPIRRPGPFMLHYFMLIGVLLWYPIQTFALAQQEPAMGLGHLAERSFISAAQLEGLFPMSSVIGAVDLLQEDVLLALATNVVIVVASITSAGPHPYPGERRFSLVDLPFTYLIFFGTLIYASGLSHCLITIGSLYLIVTYVQNGALVTNAALTFKPDSIFPENLRPQQEPSITAEERREERRVRRQERRRKRARR